MISYKYNHVNRHADQKLHLLIIFLYPMKFICKVITRASKSEIIDIEKLSRLGFDFVKKDKDMPELKIYVKAAPVDGKANKEIISLLSKTLKVSKSRIRIAKGETSNKKVIEVDD